MNAVEIADAVAELAEKPFDAVEFPFEFLAAFGNKETTIARLRKGDSNASDIEGGVLQKNNIHLAVCRTGAVGETLRKLKASSKTISNKAKFVLATDGESLEAENLKSGEPLACEFPELGNHFSFFFELAGISVVKEIRDNPIDVRATGRLNKLYVEILKTNEDWQSEERRTDLNHFFARLIFCFFAEDTQIFHGEGMFTDTVTRMSDSDGSNVDFVLGWLFRVMNLSLEARKKIDVPLWADKFPYVNGGLFSDDLPIPRFSRTARSYLIRAGELNWKEINPDIFGSMIQAVADDEERGSLGMHYTSVPNILKVLDPLFLDDLRQQLDRAGDHKPSLLKLRERMSSIRIFDPACGSGNFLVIAYKELRKIEADVNRMRGEPDRVSEITIENFRGIEIRDFAAEVARLALVIAEYQCDVLHRGERLALAEFLPLTNKNWIYKGNALRLDWTTVCPPHGTVVKVRADDLFGSPLEQTEIDFANNGGETYLCGNPPYLGFTWQNADQKADIRSLLAGRSGSSGFLDYVAGWFIKAADYAKSTHTVAAFVATNSICQGLSVPILFPIVYGTGADILFAYTSFKWANLASHKAGVTVVIIGLGTVVSQSPRRLYLSESEGTVLVRECASITPYLTIGPRRIVQKREVPLSEVSIMEFGNKPSDGGHLLFHKEELDSLGLDSAEREKFVRRIFGSQDFINGGVRFCLWVEDRYLNEAVTIKPIGDRIEAVRKVRLSSPDKGANMLAKRAHQLKLMRIGTTHCIVVPSVSSEQRAYLPVGLVDQRSTLSNLAFGLYDAPLWNLALIASRLHLVWIATVCGKLESRYRYSNTLGWNTFPVPYLTNHDKAELTKCAEDILLAREAHFPATIADLYRPDEMPDNLRRAHERNDETLERIYIGRRFRNDTERLEKLFEMYTEMTKNPLASPGERGQGVRGRKAGKQSKSVNSPVATDSGDNADLLEIFEEPQDGA